MTTVNSNRAGGNGRPRKRIHIPPEKRCTYIASDGSQCRAARQRDTDHCVFHDREFQRRVNQTKASEFLLEQRLNLCSAHGIQDLLQRNVEAVLNNQITPAVANSVGYQAQLMMANLSNLRNERQTTESEAERQYKATQKRLTDKLEKIASAIDEASGAEALDEAVQEYDAAVKKEVLG